MLRHPKVGVPLVILALLPAVIDQAPNLFLPSQPLSFHMLMLGPCYALGFLCALWILSELVATVRGLLGGPAVRLVFHEDGIREIRGRRTDEHAWTWIAEAVQVGDNLLLSCHEPLRSFRLRRGSERTIFVDLREEGAERLLRLLKLQRPGLLHREL